MNENPTMQKKLDETKSFDNWQFKRLRKLLNLNQTDFATNVGVSQQTIAMIENNKRGVPASIREGFYKKYGVSYETARECETPEELNNLLYPKLKVEVKTSNEQVVPIKFYKDAKAAAGTGVDIPETSDEEILYFDKRWLENIIGVKAENAIIIQAKGNSMDSGNNNLKDIHNGDLLFVDISVKDVINNKVFVIQQGNDLRVKKLVKDFNGDIYLISNNEKEYPPELVKQETNIIGRVVWNVSKENV